MGTGAVIDWGQPLPAPAKLNLFLHVIGRRADGYHLLQSAFRLIDRCDWITYFPRPDGSVVRQGEVAGVAEDSDLSVRAARLLQREAGVGSGVSIRLEKRLPMGAGLGGGSSDAATTFLALNHLWDLAWPAAKLAELGLRLGADVPFFIFGRSAFVEGVGERLQPLPLEPAWYLVIEPGAVITTGEMFAAPDLTRSTKAIKMADFSGAWAAGSLHNDLQPVVCARYPAVADAIAWLQQFGDARMTGSGACVFAPFASASAAQQVLTCLPQIWRGWVAKGLETHPLIEQAYLGSRQAG